MASLGQGQRRGFRDIRRTGGRFFTAAFVIALPVLCPAQFVNVEHPILELPTPSDSLLLLTETVPIVQHPVGILTRKVNAIGTEFAAPHSFDEMIWTVSFTSLFILQDRELFSATHSTIERSPFLRGTSDVMVKAGNGAYQIGFVGALGLYGFVFDDHRARETAGQCLEGILIDGLVVQMLKRVSGRESPAAATHMKGRWIMFPNPRYYEQNPAKFYSFPSGHISTTVATLTVLFNNYEELRPYKPVAYALTGLVGISLVGKGMHWYSDLPLGVFLGYVIGTAVSHPNAANSAGSGEVPGLAFRLVPSVREHQVVLNGILSF